MLDVQGIDEREGLSLISAALEAMRVGTTCSVTLLGFSGLPHFPGDSRRWSWGHLDEELVEEGIDFVDKHLATFRGYHGVEVFSRVGNALRLFSNAINTDVVDLALLGCVGAIESLFSIATQELTFRLSLYLARFLGDDYESQRMLFDRARKLYGVRSKIAHGERIASSEERAAISLVEFWTPEAADLTRQCLKRLFERGLTELFDSREQHAELLTSLLFSQNLDAALTA